MAAVVTVRGLASSGFVVNVFSGAVAQSVVISLLNEPGLHDVRPKPFTVWPLVVNGRVVWNRALTPAGAAVELRVAFFQRTPSLLRSQKQAERCSLDPHQKLWNL